jgi:hypothetical protein
MTGGKNEDSRLCGAGKSLVIAMRKEGAMSVGLDVLSSA